MDPATIIFLMLTALAGATVVYVAYLTVSVIRDQIRKKRTEKYIGKDAIMIKECLESGKYRVVTGFWDDNKLKEYEVFEADKLDPFLSSVKEKEAVVLR